MRSLEGVNLGPYRLIEQIGRGGMAIVYKAYDPSLERFVALKILPEYYKHDEDFSTRFRREARNVAKLRHPNILPIYAYDEQDGLSYFVMDLVEGGTLKDLMGDVLELPRTVSLITQLAGALHYAHELHIVHRDVKPANVLMSRPDWPMLSDFGIARVLEQSSGATTNNAFLGTPHYMAPEQAQGLPVSPRTDQYALGVVLYEMLAGSPPFQADTPQAVMFQHIYATLSPPREHNPEIPEALERVVLTALEKEPQNRFEDMAAFAAALRQAAGESDTLTSTSSRPRIRSSPAEPLTAERTGGATERLPRTSESTGTPANDAEQREEKGEGEGARRPWTAVALTVGGLVVSLIVFAVIFLIHSSPSKSASSSPPSIALAEVVSGHTVNLGWTAVPNAQKYRVQVAPQLARAAEREIFKHPIRSNVTGGTSETISVPDNRVYRWRVAVSINGAWTSYTSSQRFTAASPVPVTTAPALGAGSWPCRSGEPIVRSMVHGLTVQLPRGAMRRARLDMCLPIGTSLHTGKGQRASIAFKDGTTLHINGNTDVLLRSPSVTTVQRGEVAEFPAPGTSHRVQTAAAVASAIG